MTCISFQQYVWPSFVIWGFDRLLRLLRVLVFALSPLADKQPNLESYHQDTRSSTMAAPELELTCPDIIRLTVPRPRHFHWSPGQNIFLTIPKMTRLFPEAHPFKIAAVDCKLGDPESNPTEDESVEKSANNVDSNSNLVFFINVRSGFTKRLANQISVDAKNMNMKVFVDGPYGSPPDLRVFDTCVLLAGERVFSPKFGPPSWALFQGGMGVSFTLPLFLNLVESVTMSTVLILVPLYSLRAEKSAKARAIAAILFSSGQSEISVSYLHCSVSYFLSLIHLAVCRTHYLDIANHNKGSSYSTPHTRN